MKDHERELPMLAAIGGFFHWWEELLNILNGPLLMFGAGIALVDLLTDGSFTGNMAVLLYAWAISQALGIDLQLIGCFARARAAARQRHAWAVAGWLALGLLLAVPAWQAGYVYAIQQSQHISENAALTQVGMDHTEWLALRMVLAIGLIALAGWTRYTAPREASIEAEYAALDRELKLDPLRQQVRANKALGAVALARNTALAMAGKVPTKPPPPNGPGTPQAVRPEAIPDETVTEYLPRVASARNTTRVPASKLRMLRKASRFEGLRTQGYVILDAQPDMNAVQLRRALHCRQEVANTIYGAWRNSRRRAVAK